MKRVYLTQAYELIITVDVDVPDDFTKDDLENSLTDFPINATVESLWDDESLWGDDDTDDKLIVGSLCVDSLIAINGAMTIAITDDNGEII